MKAAWSARGSGTLAAGVLLALTLSTSANPARGAATAAHAAAAVAQRDRLAYAILKQLVETDTTDSSGNVTTAAEAVAGRFRAAGFAAADIRVDGPDPRKKNLVVRLHGRGLHKPVLLMGHLDVVEARREDWSTDPFKLIEKDGYFYGRGTLDMKGPDAIMVATLIALKQEGFQPARDVILALTADEEGGCCNGMSWLVRNHRELVEAEFALNQDDYSVILEQDRPVYFRLDASEKLYADYQLTVTSRGGHSAEPVADNAIYTLTRGLDRLAGYEFPFELNDVTREYFRRMAGSVRGERAADMRALLLTPPDPGAISRVSRDVVQYPVMRTTCVATRLEAGHANNALPQRAQAVVNCRILPGHSPLEIQQALSALLADPAITVRYLASDGHLLDQAPQQDAFAPPRLLPALMAPLERVVGEMWPGLKVIPYMSPGASDAEHTSAAGIPTYTFAGVAVDASDDREHGRDERLGVESFYRGNEFFYRLLKSVTAR
ncbi:MAG TPA: M20/M25/M40 family metallo-hydrolase [Steroidobacteraceae bacterium]|nr:M20/M25/M40 family metallo-hydrolase [Steroidobacteraceae bacterium]